jgi:hypothetical protein
MNRRPSVEGARHPTGPPARRDRRLASRIGRWLATRTEIRVEGCGDLGPSPVVACQQVSEIPVALGPGVGGEQREEVGPGQPAGCQVSQSNTADSRPSIVKMLFNHRSPWMRTGRRPAHQRRLAGHHVVQGGSMFGEEVDDLW